MMKPIARHKSQSALVYSTDGSDYLYKAQDAGARDKENRPEQALREQQVPAD